MKCSAPCEASGGRRAPGPAWASRVGAVAPGSLLTPQTALMISVLMGYKTLVNWAVYSKMLTEMWDGETFR